MAYSTDSTSAIKATTRWSSSFKKDLGPYKVLFSIPNLNLLYIFCNTGLCISISSFSSSWMMSSATVVSMVSVWFSGLICSVSTTWRPYFTIIRITSFSASDKRSFFSSRRSVSKDWCSIFLSRSRVIDAPCSPRSFSMRSLFNSPVRMCSSMSNKCAHSFKNKVREMASGITAIDCKIPLIKSAFFIGSLPVSDNNTLDLNVIKSFELFSM